MFVILNEICQLTKLIENHDEQRATTNIPNVKNITVTIKCTNATLTQSVISFLVSVERTICFAINPENKSDTVTSPANTTKRLS